MVNELEIKDALAKNDWERIARIADGLAFHHHMTFEQVVGLFARLGGDADLIRREFFSA